MRLHGLGATFQDEPYVPAARDLRSRRDPLLELASIGPAHAHHLEIAAGEAEPQALRRSRAWDEASWEQAAADLRERGWLDTAGWLTAAGAAARERVEQQTDAAAARPWEVLGAEATDRLADLLTPLAQAVIDRGGFPLPNPIGALAPRPPA